jgi:hypothetical protein
MLRTPNEGRTLWLERVSDAATALAAYRDSCGESATHAPSASKYKLTVMVGGMVAIVLAISLSALIAFQKVSLRGIQQLIQQASELGSSVSSSVRSLEIQPTARLIASPPHSAVPRGPTPLGLAVEGRAENAVVIITGLAPKMELSAGNTVASDKWQISVAQLANAWIAPPENFSGSIDLAAELLLSDGKIADRAAIRVEWVLPSSLPLEERETALEEPAPAVALASAPAKVDREEKLSELQLLQSPAQEQSDREKRSLPQVSSAVTPSLPDREEIAARPRSARGASLPPLDYQQIAPSVSGLPEQTQFDQKEITLLLSHGKNLMANGDLAAARIVLRRAVDANNAEAALVLAATYDPLVLRELKVYGFAGDTGMARAWYAKAAELGSSEAPRRLEILKRATDRR